MAEPSDGRADVDQAGVDGQRDGGPDRGHQQPSQPDEPVGLVTGQGIDRGKQEAARRWFRAYIDSLNQAKEALPKWETAVAGDTGDRNLVGRTTALIGEMIERMRKTAADLGVKLK